MSNFLATHDDPLSLALSPSEALEITAGDPQASELILYRAEFVECGVWEVTRGTFVGENIGFGEHMRPASPSPSLRPARTRRPQSPARQPRRQ